MKYDFKKQVISLKKEVHRCNKANKSLVKKLESISDKFHVDLAKKIEHEKSKSHDIISGLKESGTRLEQTNKKLSDQLRDITKSKDELSENCDYLQNLLQDNEELIIYDNDERRFTPDCTKCVMNLLSYGVASENVGKVIQVVCKLCGRIPNQVPARQTVDNINRQRLAVAHKQLQETFSDAENVTLYTDETSRKGHKYTVYATTTGTATAVVGVQELVSKSAQDTLQGLIDVVNRTAAVCSQEELGAGIVASLKNTMSDRASTEELFNKLLQSYRASILPTVIRKWNELTPEEQTDSVRMNIFFVAYTWL